MLKACKQKAQGHYYVGMPDLMEGLDVLAAMKGTDKVLLDTVMQPEVLERQMQQINDIYFQVFNELYDIIREGDEMAFCYFSAWAPGKMTKLQSDISTMISVDDYRRFVQPFIREQCQKIDYTLYHLDGVGAMHHLPALLEIEELNAIQWTPGVGEPQGGDPKWYDLYNQILAGGKSVMACWVTLDELRPLLDHIGGDGVHLEMDFHNEKEVEQAMRIIEEYQSRDEIDQEVDEIIRLTEDSFRTMESEKPSSSPQSLLEEVAQNRILVLDGGMGTMIQQYHLQEKDFRGTRFAEHQRPLAGCNDVLSLTCPQIIQDIHRKYLEAGADLIETNTFNAQRISLSGYGLEESCREMNLEACRIAREVADEYTEKTPQKPRFVIGSVGPTSKTCSMSSDGGEPFSQQLLAEAYQEQIEALIDGGVDALLVETIFDTLHAEIAMKVAVQVMKERNRYVPMMLSFNIATADGFNMLGQNIPDFIEQLSTQYASLLSLEHTRSSLLFSVGINCLSDVKMGIPVINEIAQRSSYRISLYPNAGKPDGKGGYSKSPEELQKDLWPLAEAHLLNVIGGCCGTTDKYIEKIAQLVQPVEGLYLTPRKMERVVAEVKNDHRNETPSPSPDAPSSRKQSPADRLFDAILGGDSVESVAATQDAIATGLSPQEIINGQMIRAMGEVGQRFQDGKAFVPQLLMAGRAMKAALELLKPLMAGSSSMSIGKVLIGTVKGDLHDIGKNLVASMLEGCGFEVINIGIDVPAETFVDEIRKNKPNILCMSALLTTTMGYMKEVIDALKEAGIRNQVKVMVGGAPVSQAFADEIGADGYSDNANTAVAVAKQLMGIA